MSPYVVLGLRSSNRGERGRRDPHTVGVSLSDLAPYGEFANRLGGKIIDFYVPGAGTKLSESVESGFKGKIAEEQQAKSDAQAQADAAGALTAAIAADDAARKSVGDALVSQARGSSTADADRAVAQQALAAMDAAGAKVPSSLAPQRITRATRAVQQAAAAAAGAAQVARNVRAAQRDSAQAKLADARARLAAAQQVLDRVRGTTAAPDGTQPSTPPTQPAADDTSAARATQDYLEREVAAKEEQGRRESARTLVLGVAAAGAVGLLGTVAFLLVSRR